MEIIRSLWLIVVAFLLLPTYVLGIISWRRTHGSWVIVSPIKYAEYARDWVTYLISSVCWFVLFLLIHLIELWSKY